MRILLLAIVVGLGASGCAGDPQEPDLGTMEVPPAMPDAPPTPPEVDRVDLADVLPDVILDRMRESLDLSRDGALGAEIETAKADYGEITVSVTDYKTAEMTEMMGYGWALAPNAEQIDGHPGKVESAAHSASVQLVIDGRYLVDVAASTEEDARRAIASLDLSRL